MLDALLTLDKTVFLFCNNTLGNPVLDAVFVPITDPSFWIIPGLIMASFFVWEKKGLALLVLGVVLLAVGLSDALCNQVIKYAVHRLRPCNPHALIEGGRFLLGYKTSLSFPSSHAMNIFTAATVFTGFFRRQWPWFYGFALLIAFSRIYVGVHFPGDVLGGALFGMLIGGTVYWFFAMLRTWFSRSRARKKQPENGAVER